MKIIIINLESAADRRAQVKAQLEPMELDFELFRAIDSTAATSHFSGINRWLCLMEIDRQPTPSEVACFASHRGAWQRCVELDAPVLVCEDDVLFDANVADALDRVTAVIDEYGFMRMEDLQEDWHWWDCGRPEHVADLGPFAIYHQTTPSLRATAYAVTPQAASALLADSHEFPCALDHYLRRTWSHRQPLFALLPAPCHISELSEQTTIEGRQTYKRPYLVRRTRKLYKYFARWQQSRFNRQVMSRYQ